MCDILFNDTNHEYQSSLLFESNSKIILMNFAMLCESAKTPEDIYNIVKQYKKYNSPTNNEIKQIFNTYIGYGVPSRKVCEMVCEIFEDSHKYNKRCRLIEVGANSGIFSRMIYSLCCEDGCRGIIAYGLTSPTMNQRQYFPINTEVSIKKDDILFISWGDNEVSQIVDKYISIGGRQVIILGDYSRTFPANYFCDNDEWDVEMIGVDGMINRVDELSINTKKKSNKGIKK